MILEHTLRKAMQHKTKEHWKQVPRFWCMAAVSAAFSNQGATARLYSDCATFVLCIQVIGQFKAERLSRAPHREKIFVPSRLRPVLQLVKRRCGRSCVELRTPARFQFHEKCQSLDCAGEARVRVVSNTI